jgi:hypothetical protein
MLCAPASNEEPNFIVWVVAQRVSCKITLVLGFSRSEFVLVIKNRCSWERLSVWIVTR